MKETQLYHMIEKEMIKACLAYNIVPGMIDYCRIESPSSPGIPDINYCILGVEFWIECKIKYKEASRNQLKPNQKAWHHRRELAGGIVYVLRYSEKDNFCCLIRKEQKIWEGSLAATIDHMLHESRVLVAPKNYSIEREK